MGIIQAEERHIKQVAALLAACMREMRRNGIDQWDEDYPNATAVAKDVQSRSAWILEEPECIAAISLNEEQDPTYQTVRWTGGGPALVVHRLCVDPSYQRKGIANRLMAFAEWLAREREYASIRLDTYSGNPPALRLYERLGYQKTGEIYLRGKTTPFFCFEKILAR